MKLPAAAAFAALALPYALAQAPCPRNATALAGIVHDATHAIVPGASLTLDGGTPEMSSGDGRFRFNCVAEGPHQLSVSAEGFATQTLALKAPHTATIDLTLKLQEVETSLDVDGDDSTPANSAAASGPTQSISGNRLQSLADDPDDLLRQLQQLAAAAGGNPSNATIAVDGFQDSSKLPPKSSIAYIKVNPDQFSAEYREPPFGGGRVEVYTKPGQPTFHGALFMTNGSPWMNARDPFSTSKAALGKQRYGFELTGPIRKKGSDFTMTLEHRSIDNFAVVNAITLDANGNQTRTVANVATPQRLWIGTAKVDWQLGAKNTFIASYSPNVNHLRNVGVGGTSLPEAGYDSQQYEHVLRFSDVTTISAHLMHEARLSLKWDGETDNPTATAPALQVAGAFTGGGATLGPQRLRELATEYDDDAILTTKNHTIKAGMQLWIYRERQQLTNNFNGTYNFGGGIAPVLDANGNPTGQTQTISGIEQYRRALAHLPGGTPTAYSNVAGSPEVNFTIVQNAFFVQDDWNVGHGVHIASGLRYFWQTDPTVLGSITPRMGILWSPDKKNRWTLHAHGGTFAGRFNRNAQSEVQRLNGVDRIASTVYSPVFGSPLAGSTAIHTVRQYSPHLSNLTWGAWNIGGTRVLPFGFNLSADYYQGRIWNYTRSNNINSPLNNNPYGPRPGAANLNILQMQPSGQGRVNATFVGIEQHTMKRVQFFFGGVRVNLIDDTDDNEFSTPQSSTSNAGEFAHRTGQPMWNLFGNGSLKLPQQLQLSANFNAGGDAHYNITTGFDNNGDGNFNDRPRYATPGQTGAIQTPYGLLIASGGTGVFPRNQGVMPWTFYLDTNLQRAFKLTRNTKAEHPQTLTVNLRSANVLNHMNVKSVGGVLGSPLFGTPYTADNGRRIEAGLRYSF
ncbi:MAG: TonB-dependent receptor [Acidobacteria bacterium]|nr:TonB-dependent receptor [Acidobacteriota bacterium]